MMLICKGKNRKRWALPDKRGLNLHSSSNLRLPTFVSLSLQPSRRAADYISSQGEQRSLRYVLRGPGAHGRAIGHLHAMTNL